MSRTKPALVQEKRCVLGSENNVSVALSPDPTGSFSFLMMFVVRNAG
jgi:hypothetical protein